MSTAGRCPCVRRPQNQQAREKENIPSKPQQKPYPAVYRTTVDRSSKLVVTKVVHPPAPVARSNTGSAARITQSSSETITKSYNCGCTDYVPSRKPLTDVRDNQFKIPQSVPVKSRHSEPARVQPKTENRFVSSRCSATSSAIPVRRNDTYSAEDSRNDRYNQQGSTVSGYTTALVTSASRGYSYSSPASNKPVLSYTTPYVKGPPNATSTVKITKPTANFTAISPIAKLTSDVKPTQKVASDTGFWETFRTVKSDLTSKGPHKNVRKCVPVYTTKASLQKELLERSVYDGIPLLNQKALMKQVNQPSHSLGVVNLDPVATKVRPSLLYATDIINDIILNIIKQQRRNMLRYEFLDKNVQLSEYRAALINWMIKLHHYLAPDTNVFFVAIRLFDKILASFCVQEIRYQIIALTTYWIALKYNNSVNFITAPNLLKLCNNRYTLDYFLRTEKKLLKILNFDVAVDDPMIFVYYFINIMQIEQSNIISYSSNYFLEIFALDRNINCFPLSLQAASVVYLSMKIFNYDDNYWYKVRKYYGYHDQDEMHGIQRMIFEYLMLMDDKDFPYREAYKKYASEKYDRISLKISKLVREF